MSSLFSPNAKQQVQKQITPAAAPHEQPAPQVKPDLGAPPDGPPVPVLASNYNFFGSVHEFAQRVQSVTDQHEAKFGYRPKPDVALKLALDPAQAANVFAPSPSELALQQHPLQTDAEFVKEMRQAAQGPGWDAWLHDNADRVQLLQADKRWGAQVHAVVLSGVAHAGEVARAEAAGASPELAQKQVTHKEQVDKAGVADLGAVGHALGAAAGKAASLGVHVAAGVVEYSGALSRAADVPFAKADVWLNRRFGVPISHQERERASSGSVGRFVDVNKAIGVQTAHDLAHPEDPLPFTLSLLGVPSLGGGSFARLGAVGKALWEGGTVGDAALAALVKPTP